MRCVFCSLRHQTWAEEKYEYISEELWKQYIDAVAEWLPKCRMEIANRGEQTIHSKFLELIAYARQKLPRVQILVSTNGDLSQKIREENYVFWVDQAQQAGVNIFMFDCYTQPRLDQFTRLFSGRTELFFDGFNPYPYRSGKFKALCIKDAVPRPVKENRILQYHNQGGNAVVSGKAAELYNIPVLEEPLQRMCARPFREMPMWLDGSIPICCDDWADKGVVGKFPDKTLKELWLLYDPYRKNLLEKNRGAQKPCDKCSERAGFRWALEKKWFDEK